MKRRSNPRWMDMLTLKEACALFHVSYHTLWSGAWDGRLMCEKFSFMYATTAAWVQAYLERYYPSKIGAARLDEIDIGPARLRVLATVSTKELHSA